MFSEVVSQVATLSLSCQ